MEEAGAVLHGEPRYFAAHVADSNREKPYRPHLPHPRAYWAYAIADVQVVEAPTNPVDGETVVEVLTPPPAAAARYIEEHTRSTRMCFATPKRWASCAHDPHPMDV